jgi:hypothetical protein
MLGDELGGVNLMIAKNFKPCEINLIKHVEYNLLLILQNSIAHAQIQRN